MAVMPRKSRGRRCPVCKEELGWSEVTKVYCSASCRQQAYRRRKAETTIEDEAVLAALAADGTAQLRRLRLTIQRLLRTEALGAPAHVRRPLHEAVRSCKFYEELLQRNQPN